jgi:hypothetical protein
MLHSALDEMADFNKPCRSIPKTPKIAPLYAIWGCGQKAGQAVCKRGGFALFTYQKRIRALQLYEETHSVTETIRILGYPERQTLYNWIRAKDQPQRVKSTYRGENTPEHPRPPIKLKPEVLHRCCANLHHLLRL